MTFVWYAFAAVAEIAGCFTFWMWLRGDHSAWWLLPGMAALALFAVFLTQAEVQFAGRAFAAYGGIYIVASLMWLRWIEDTRLLASDYVGAMLCLLGAGIIVLGPIYRNL